MDVLKRSFHRGTEDVEDEKGVGLHGDGDLTDFKVSSKSEKMGIGRSDSKPTSPNQTDSSNQEDQIISAKAEMGEVREENERLKTILAQIAKDYQSLQMHFFDIVHQEQIMIKPESEVSNHKTEEPELVSLSLGTTNSSTIHKKEEKTSNFEKGKEEEEDRQVDEGLSLGLDCRFNQPHRNPIEISAKVEIPERESPENISEESKEEEINTEAWHPNTLLKTSRGPEDEISQQAHVKKARVSVRARCDAPTMNDGCQWRKYGQKIAKGNPCPRAYYRCTVAPACPVRKQVQRYAEDMSILITTYEGTHNHPLPISATAMASTTSAAASMLNSGPLATRPSSSAALQSLAFNLTDPSSRANPNKPFFFPTPTISSTPSYPTITLDLTQPPSRHFFSPPSNLHQNQRYPTNSFSTLNFSSEQSNIMTPNPWPNSSYFNSASQSQFYNKGHHMVPSTFVRTPQDHFYPSLLQKPSSVPSTSSSLPLTDSIAAATKAITSDPNFRSALAAAITSIVSGGHGPPQGGGDILSFSQKAGVEGPIQAIPYHGSGTVGACGSSFMSQPSGSGSGSGSQAGGLTFLSQSMPFGSSKSASASPVVNRDHIS
ncbi:probable WRKY transcription factor 72 [Amborella trichopoda]|uniref:WRKY domain-containing protein n=1 Tax=Amborella trichopoda TaxID=13333 RepID=W1P893_AMBTC|nr:probable WRKY transcription factor 72 [Amborella trichopoda]ERN03816.1 hypothetical protein AMTR_s00078p00123870 [Amborella trichopoda]|eukprot:XP_006842141.1 probable WRKY transcription factor 72 [Amborella trichopoda]